MPAMMNRAVRILHNVIVIYLFFACLLGADFGAVMQSPCLQSDIGVRVITYLLPSRKHSGNAARAPVVYVRLIRF